MGTTVSLATLLAAASGQDAFFDEDVNDPNGFTISDMNTSFHISGGSGHFVGFAATDGVVVDHDQIASTFFQFGNEAFDDFQITGRSSGSISSFFTVSSNALPPQIGFDHIVNSVKEGSLVTYNLTRSFVGMGDTGSSVEVHFSTDVTDTAVAGVNYIPQLTALGATNLVDNGGNDWTLTFAPGVKTAAFTVTTLDDHAVPLANPQFGLFLSDPEGAELAEVADATDTTITNIDRATVDDVTSAPGSGTIHAGQHVNIELTLSDPVTVTGNPTLRMSTGEVATLTSWSGNTLDFDYLPKLNQNIATLTVNSVTLPNGSSIKDQTGAAANLAGANNHNLHLAVDTIAPKVLKAAFLDGSTPLNPGASVAQDDHVTFDLTFSEPVTVTGTPLLLLSDGATATYTGGDGTGVLTFDYHVLQESATDLKIIGVDLSGGSITNVDGNDLPTAFAFDTKLKVNVFTWNQAVDGDFGDAMKWTPQTAPGPGSTALITAAGKPYTVTTSNIISIAAIATGKGAVLSSDHDFTVTEGTGAGANAGTIALTGADLRVGDGTVTTFNNTGLVSLSNAGLNVVGDVTLAGTGKVMLSDNSANAVTGDTLTNAGNAIMGAGSIVSNEFFNQAKGVINGSGVLNPLLIAPGGIVENAGIFEGTTSAGLVIASNVTNSNLIEALSPAKSTGAKVEINSTIINTTKGIVLASGVGAHVDLDSATIEGGTLKTTGGSGATAAAVNVTGDSTFDGSTAGNPLNNAALVNITNGHALVLEGTINNTGTVTLNSTGNQTALGVSDNVTLKGGGKVTFGDSNTNVMGNIPNNDAVLTNVDNKISGSGHIGDNPAGGTFALINQAKGVINGNGAVNTLTLSSANQTIQNFGIFEGTSAKGLEITGDLANSNLIEASGIGASLLLGDTTTVHNTTKGIIEASGVGAHVDIDIANIIGGALKTTGGAGATAASFNILEAVSFDGSTVGNIFNNSALVQVNDGANLEIAGTINNTGKIMLGANAGPTGTTLYISDLAAATLNGSGTIILASVHDIVTSGDDDTGISSLTNNGNTISGAGTVGIGDDALDFFNTKGVVAANVAGDELDINTKSFHNGGILESTNGGTLEILTDIANTSSGLVETLAANSHINLDNADITGGKVSVFKGSFFDSVGGDNTITATVTNAGRLGVEGDNLTVVGTVNNSGLLDADGHALDLTKAVTGSGTATVENNGTLEFGAAASTKVTFGAGGDKLVLDTSTSTFNKFTGTISGFDADDHIQLLAFNSATESVSQKFTSTTSGTVTVSDGVNHSITLNFVGDYTASAPHNNFVVQDDVNHPGHIDLFLA